MNLRKLKKILKRTSVTQYVVGGLWAITLASILVGWLWVAFPLMILIAGLLLPYKRTFGLVSRLVMTSVLVASTTSLIGIVFWLVHAPISTLVLAVIYFVLVTVLAVRRVARPTITSRFKDYFPLEDFAALLAGVIAMTVLLLPLSLNRDTATLMRLVGSGVDNIAHLNFTNLVEQSKGYLYGKEDSPINAQLGRGATAYPQGYHLNAAIINQVVQPTNERSVRDSLLLFELIAVASFGILVYLVSLTAIVYVRRMFTGKNKYLIVLVASVASLYVLSSVLLKLFLDGFQPQIAAMSLLFFLVILLYGFVDRGSNKVFHLVCSLIVTAAIGLFYLYLLPVAVGLTAIYVWQSLRKKELTFKKPGWVLLGLLAATSLIQPLLYVVFSHASLSKLNEAGGTLVLNTSILIAVVLGAVAYIGFRKGFKKPDPMVGLFILSTLFAGAIYLFQVVSVGGEPSYYYHKSTYALLIVAVIILLPVIVNVFSALKKVKYTLLIAIVASVALLWSGQSPALGWYIQREPYSFSYPLAKQTTVLAEKINTINTENILSVGNNCVGADDLRLMRFLMTFSEKANPAQEQIAEYSYSISVRPEVYRMVAKYQKQRSGEKLTIIAADPTVREGIVSAIGSDESNIEFIDPYLSFSKPTRPLTGCAAIDSLN